MECLCYLILIGAPKHPAFYLGNCACCCGSWPQQHAQLSIVWVWACQPCSQRSLESFRNGNAENFFYSCRLPSNVSEVIDSFGCILSGQTWHDREMYNAWLIPLMMSTQRVIQRRGHDYELQSPNRFHVPFLAINLSSQSYGHSEICQQNWRKI